MKRALILAVASLGWTAAAIAQSPNAGPSPGPHDPNPPMNAPDLRLPPPCAPSTSVAATDGIMNPATSATSPASSPRVTAVDDNNGNLQCSANMLPQSAALPGLAPGMQ